jgi:hypothetical protein
MYLWEIAATILLFWAFIHFPSAIFVAIVGTLLFGVYHLFTFLFSSGVVSMFLAAMAASVFFWPIILIVLFLLLLTEHEVWGTALIVTVVGLLLFFAPTSVPLVTLDPWVIGMWIVGYIGLALPATGIRWWFYTRKRGRKFGEYVKAQDAISALGRHHNYPEGKMSKEDLSKRWNDREARGITVVKWVSNATGGGKWDLDFEVAPMVGYCSVWALYWPMYMVLIVVEDFLQELVRALVIRFGGGLRAVATAAFNQPV